MNYEYIISFIATPREGFEEFEEFNFINQESEHIRQLLSCVSTAYI
jgi:hypothetical protein